MLKECGCPKRRVRWWVGANLDGVILVGVGREIKITPAEASVTPVKVEHELDGRHFQTRKRTNAMGLTLSSHKESRPEAEQQLPYSLPSPALCALLAPSPAIRRSTAAALTS